MPERPEARYALVRFVAAIAFTLLALFLTSLTRPFLPFGQTITSEYTRLSVWIYLLVALIWSGILLLLPVYALRTLRSIDGAQLIFAAVTLSTLTWAGRFISPYVRSLGYRSLPSTRWICVF